MTEQAEDKGIDLEKFRLAMTTYIHEELLEDFVISPIVAINDTYASGALMERLLHVSVKQEVYGETLGTLEVKHPATWFQMLKEQYAPYWLKRRWPVRYDIERWDARVLYPLVSLPDETHNRVWVRNYRDNTTQKE